MPESVAKMTTLPFRSDSLPLIMGIVNVTPDSFSDGGQFLHHTAAIQHAARLIQEGADILDIGGESTRPGSEPVSADEEQRRVVPVIQGIRDAFPGFPISIDTSKATVAQAAVEEGATWINDVTSGLGDPEMFSLAASAGTGLILMHMQGTPKTMQHHPTYRHVIEEVRRFFSARIEAASDAGVLLDHLVLDPGIGFGKELQHNLELMSGLPELKQLGHPLLLGVSRKRWIGDLTGRSVEDRLAGSLAGAIACMLKGADLLRVHDVGQTVDALRVADRILRPEGCKD